jgi:hypothetical protein
MDRIGWGKKNGRTGGGKASILRWVAGGVGVVELVVLLEAVLCRRCSKKFLFTIGGVCLRGSKQWREGEW